MTEKEAEMNEFCESADKLSRTLPFFPCADTEHRDGVNLTVNNAK